MYCSLFPASVYVHTCTLYYINIILILHCLIYLLLHVHAFGLIYEGAIGQPRWTASLCNAMRHTQSLASSVTIYAKTTVHCSPDSSMFKRLDGGGGIMEAQGLFLGQLLLLPQVGRVEGGIEDSVEELFYLNVQLL